MSLKFKIGDRVRVTSRSAEVNERLMGQFGVVVVLDKHDSDLKYGVRLDKAHGDLHDLGGRCPGSRGWWFSAKTLTKVGVGAKPEPKVPSVPSKIGEIPVKPKIYEFRGKSYLMIDSSKPLMFSKTQDAFQDDATPIRIVGILPSSHVMTESGSRYEPSFILCPAKYLPAVKMTQLEIEAKLGFKIEIIEE